MPERRIDAISKADATAWTATQASKKQPNLVKIISGTLAQMKPGEVIHTTVQKAGNDTFKITLNGESFIIKGLPASLIGKEVAFITQKNMLQGKLKNELFWIGASQAGNTTKQTGQKTLQQSMPSQSGQQAKLLSSLPTDLKTGQTVSARVDAILGKHMQISMTIKDLNTPNQNMRHQMLTTSINGLTTGQYFHASIHVDKQQQATLKLIPPTGTTAIESSKKSNHFAHFKLTAGATTVAIVQQRLSNGQVQLNIQGSSVETSAPAGIKKGDVLMLKLTKKPADFQLVSVHKDAASKALATLKANLSVNNSPLSQNIAAMRNILPSLPSGESAPTAALSRLEAVLKSFEVSAQQPLNGERLGQMIHHSGTSLESKLLSLSQNPTLSPSLQQDLKSIMLQLANAQSSTAQHSKLINTLTELGQQGITRIESGQALNVLAQMQAEPIRVELPMLINQNMVNVQLSIQQNETYQPDNHENTSASSDQAYNILFALELSQLGKIRIDANISDHSVHARIYSENTTSNQFIIDHLQRLEERLQGLGFEEVYLISSHQQPEAEKKQRFDQLTQMMPAPSSLNLLDIRV